ncbi:MAG TPA: DUF6265 family protein [Pirellulaceae bacterium]|nr:DUF6265 family protein [Pirellulaceae bacterium]HMO92535.1 DUF6265 family protein [Pirellulaceae bacterium]HMP68982.1 DUF6265 family protein [Pirellulaceae bacterium]
MTSRIFRILFCPTLWICCLWGVIFPPCAFTQGEYSIAELQFLSGAWEMSVPERGLTITEHWMQPLGGAMIGMGRTVVGDQMKSWESLRIIQRETGIEYIAKPSEKSEETTFKLTKLTKTEAVFENPDHDFPQRIIYRLIDENSLTARIEGTRDGQTRGMDIPMKRSTEPNAK